MEGEYSLEDMVMVFFVGIFIASFYVLVGGIFIATDDDIEKHDIEVAAKICGGWNKISKFDTDGDDTFVCENGREYAFNYSLFFTSVSDIMKKEKIKNKK